MLYEKQTTNSLETVVDKLQTAAASHKFGILHIHDLKAKLNEKGIPFDRDCLVFEVCNPMQAKKVLDVDMAIANALPCRICVYAHGNNIRVSTIKPTYMLSLFNKPELEPIAKEVETAMTAMIDEACQ